jgi:hypothetical protein
MPAISSALPKGFGGRRADIMPCNPRPVNFDAALAASVAPRAGDLFPLDSVGNVADMPVGRK